jgi:signal transduction histidine kinase
LDINELINQAINSSKLDKEKIKIVLHLEEKLPRITGDKQALLSAFVELIDNAVYEILKSKTQKKGRTVSSCVKSNSVVIEFIDTGPGIPPENKGKIFSPFFTTREDKTGSGLSFVKYWIERHNGSIREMGIYGGGARFEILIPSK